MSDKHRKYGPECKMVRCGLCLGSGGEHVGSYPVAPPSACFAADTNGSDDGCSEPPRVWCSADSLA